MSKKSIALTVILLAGITWNLAVFYVDRELQRRSYPDVYDDCHKVWSSRGLYRDKSEQNSVTAFQRAFDRGASGAEVDFHYDVAMDRFVISHDHPRKGPDGRFVYPEKEGGLLTLESLLQRVGEGHAFWLDYKNLDKLSVKETEQAIRRLQAITAGDAALRGRLYIEGSNPLRLSMYTDAGFKTILGIHPLPESNPVASIVVNAYKIAYTFMNITGIALAYGAVENPIYGKATRKRLGPVPIFLFHVPDDAALLRSLMGEANVRALLVGRDVSIDRFAVNACKAP